MSGKGKGKAVDCYHEDEESGRKPGRRNRRREEVTERGKEKVVQYYGGVLGYGGQHGGVLGYGGQQAPGQFYGGEHGYSGQQAPVKMEEEE